MDLFSIEKTNVTGNPAILNDSAKMALQGLTVYGRSNQTKTTGAQLLDLNNMPLMTNTGATVSRLDDGGFIINGTPAKQYEQYICVPIKLDAGTYYISGGENKNGGVYAQIAINKAGSTIDWAYNRSFTVDGTETSLVFIMQTGSYTSNIDNYRIYPMLNKGTTALPWEPYTGAKASPSLEYPQEIENAKPKLYFTNANLFSYSCCTSNGLTAVKNADGSMTITGTATNNWANITELYNELYLTKGNYVFSIDKPIDVRVGIKHDRTYAMDGKNYSVARIMPGNTSVKYTRNYDSHYLSIFLEGITIGENYNLTITPTLCYSGSSATPYKFYPPPHPISDPKFEQRITRHSCFI